MNYKLSHSDRERIKAGIERRYSQVASSPEKKFRFPTGRAGLEALGYNPNILKALPEEVLSFYCGVGQPFALGPIQKGETVLDIGCGAGVDTLIAALMVGPKGRTVGVDLVPEMMERAKTNLTLAGLQNVNFQQASAEELPFADESFDVVISNGVFNLIPDKAKGLRETLRVLKPGGRFMVADQVLTVEQPSDAGVVVENWAK